MRGLGFLSVCNMLTVRKNRVKVRRRASEAIGHDWRGICEQRRDVWVVVRSAFLEAASSIKGRTNELLELLNLPWTWAGLE